MSDSDHTPSPDQLLARLNEQDRALNNPEKLGALRELLRAGISVGKAANHLNLPVSVAWRMVTSDKPTQKALTDGDDLRRRQLRAQLESRADDMLQVIVSLAHDPDIDGSVRLKAAQDILDRAIYEAIREECPGWDLDVLMKTFDEFLGANPNELPRNYSKRFYGFVKKHHERNRYQLPGF